MIKKFKIGYWISTGLLSAMLFMSAGMYVFNHAEIVAAFTSLGFPIYIIYPLAAAKLTGALVLLLSKNTMLREWAYVAFFFNFVLAFFAHFQVGDGEQMGALIALILLSSSYFFNLKKSSLVNSEIASA